MAKVSKIQNVLQLTPLQEGLLFHHHLDEDKGKYTTVKSFEIAGALNVDRFRMALDLLFERHEVLRSLIVEGVHKNPLQVVLTTRKPELEFLDVAADGDLDARLASARKHLVTRPFDLLHDVLIRFCVIKTAPERFELMIAWHHLILDGWSIETLFGELHELYESQVRDRPANLPLPFKYSKFVEWLHGTDNAAALGYWSRYIAGFDSITPFPFRTAGLPGPGGASESLSLGIGADTLQAVETLLASTRVTMNIFVQTVWGILLAKYNNCSDSMYGTVVSGRPEELEGAERIVGCLINTVPVRISYEKHTVFGELLGAQQRSFLDSLQYQHCPLSQIQSLSNARAGLFDHIVAFQNFPDQEDFADQKAVEVPLLSIDSGETIERSHYDVDIRVSYKPHSFLQFDFAYNPSVFGETSMANLGTHLMNVIKQVAAEPQKPVSAIRLAGGEEASLLDAWSRSPAPREAGEETVITLFERQVAANPEGACVVHAGQAFSFGQIATCSDNLAYHLVNRKNVRPGDVIGILLDRNEHLILSVLGVLKAGATFLTLNSTDPRSRKMQVLTDAAVRIVITDTYQALDVAEEYPCDFVIAELEIDTLEPAPVPVNRCNPESPAYVMYTSGSTGAPKGVVISNRSLSNYIVAANESYFQELPRPVFGLVTNPAFDLSLTTMFCPLTLGGMLRCYSGETSVAVQDAFYDGAGVQVIKLTPSHLGLIRAIPLRTSNIRCVILGGESVSRADVDFLAGRFGGISVFNEYGPTETTVGCTFQELLAGQEITIGKPFGGASIFVLNPEHLPAPVGIAGEIFIGGPGVAVGYLNAPELTAARFVDVTIAGKKERVYRTGDRGKWRVDGQLSLDGRLDRQLKLNGHRVEIGEIEHAMINCPGISMCAIIAGNEGAATRLTAFYTGDRELADNEIRQALSERIPQFAIPSRFAFVREFPLTQSGKTDYEKLRRVDLQPVVVQTGALTEFEKSVLSVFEEVLEKKLTLADNFFSAGGHSLHAVRVVQQLRHTLKLDVELSTIFNQPDFSVFIKALPKQETALPSKPVAIEDQDHYGVSHGQRRLWILQQFDNVGAAYHISGSFEVYDLQVGLLKEALQLLADRHEVLRTVIVEVSGHPRQRVRDKGAPAALFVEVDLADGPQAQAQLAALAQQNLHPPFDLAQGPLLRLTVVGLAGGIKRVLFTMHHLISDGWSQQVFTRELTSLYEALRQGRRPALPALKMQYRDFSAYQHGQLGASWAAGHYWQDRFREGVPVLGLWTDKPRPAVKTFNGALHRLPIGGAARAGLEDKCLQEQVTLFTLLLACVGGLLWRYSGQEDLVIGSPVAGRELKEMEDQIGFYVNTVALRLRVEGQQSVQELIGQVREVVSGGLAHQSYPFDKLVDELNLSRDLSRSPLFDVLMSLEEVAEEEIPEEQMAEEGTSREQAAGGAGYRVSKFDLSFYWERSRRGLWLTIEYNTDLFYQHSIERLGDNLVQLIQSALAQPETSLARLDSVADAEKQLIVTHAKGPHLSFPKSGIDRIFASLKNAPGITLQDHSARPVSPGALCSASERMASALMDQYQIRKGDIVGLHLEKSVAYVVAVLATLRAGAAFLPLEKDLPAERVKYILEDSNCKLVLDDQHALLRNPGSPGDGAAFTGFPDVQEDDLAYVIYTSGSTGNPKGVMVTHGNLSNFIGAMDLVIPVPDKAHFLSLTAISFDISLLEILWSLARGISLTLLDGKNLTALDAFLSRDAAERGINMVQTTPSMLKILLRDDVYDPFLGRLETILIGGEALLPEVAGQLAQRTPARTFNMYGPTETTIWSTVAELAAPEVSIGRPIANTEVFVLDRHGQMAPLGVPGRLFIGGAGVARGYMNRPELTQDRFVKTQLSDSLLYDTGDMVKLGPDGRMHYLNRADFQVKIRGHRIEPGEIEHAIRKSGAVTDVVVLDSRDVAGEPYLVAFYTAAGEVQDLPQALSAQLPAYMIPARFTRVNEIPLTTSGKADRKKLLEDNVSRTIAPASVALISPRNDFEEKLLAIWQEILASREIGINTNFFEAGGDSLKAIRLISAIKRRLPIEPGLGEIFRFQSVQAFAESYKQAGGSQKHRYLLTLKAGTPGNEKNAFFVPPILGTSLIYKKLFEIINIDVNFYGLQYKGFDYNEPFDGSIEAMAQRLAEEILSVQHEGYFHLAGFSMGGFIAYEIARLLENKGYQTSVTIIETQLGRGADKLSVDELKSRYTNELDRFLALHEIEGLDRVKSLVLHNVDLLSRYKVSGAINGNIVAIEGDDSMEEHYNMKPWAEYTRGDFRHAVITGNHYEIFEKEHLPELAAQFNELFGEILTH